jgi:hypothetical protein
MKSISRAELALEKQISKLEGQLASAKYALNLMRSSRAAMFSQRAARRLSQMNGDGLVHKYASKIPLFS